MAALVMAIASSSDSYICSISAHVACDIIPPYFIVKEKDSVSVARCISAAIGMSALIFVFIFNDIIAVLLLSHDIIVSTLFVSIFMAVTSDTPSRKGATFSIITGISCFILFQYVHILIPATLVTLCMSFISYYIGYLMELNLRTVSA